MITAIVIGAWFKRISICIAALLAMIIPVAAGFGIWAFFYSTIGLAVTIVVALTIGVVIDDTVHLFHRMKYGVDHLSFDTRETVEYSVHRVGAPIVATTLLLAIGFLPLIFSTFQVNSTFAICTTAILTLSLAFDLVLLPYNLIRYKVSLA